MSVNCWVKIRRIWYVICLVLITYHLSLITSSCTQDAYEKGDGELSSMVAEMGDGYTASDKKVTRFVTDNGEQFSVSNPFTSNLMQKPDTVYRAVFYYINKGEKAEVKGLNKVLVVTPRKMKEMKADPVRLESVWMGKSKAYLNLSLYLMQGYTDDKEAIHKIGFSCDSLYQNADGTKTLRLTFYHDQAGVPEYYSQRTFVSIPMQAVDADSIRLDINTYEGLVVKLLKI